MGLRWVVVHKGLPMSSLVNANRIKEGHCFTSVSRLKSQRQLELLKYIYVIITLLYNSITFSPHITHGIQMSKILVLV